MKFRLKLCGAVLLSAAAAMAQTASSAPAVGTANSSTSTSATADEVRELRAALAAQQQQLQAQQKRIEELAEKLQKQSAASEKPASDGLGLVASTTPIIPAGREVKTDPIPASLGQQMKSSDHEAASDSIVLAQGKVKIGFTGFGQWGDYFSSGFGPQFVTQTNYPGPGNDNYNSFDITRTYLNFVYSPTDWVSFRATPNVYRQIGGASADKFGKVSGIGSSVDGNLTMRMKYAYAEFGKVFDGSSAFKGGNIRLGMQMNPLVDWEEGLYGFRFTSLTPWNYLSLSSTHTGVSINGPIMMNGKQYVDYQVGVFDNSNFHQYEASATKQVMARASLYPFGASSKYQGLGLTGFIDYGFSNTTPDSTNNKLYRMSALAHYTSKKGHASIAGEYDLGENAFGAGNLFSGAAPQDLFGIGVTPYANMTALAKSFMGSSTKQEGYDFFGHVDIPSTKLALFGLYQNFQPNTNVHNDPFDFQRAVIGVAYRANKNLRFAVDNQDLIYTNKQSSYPSTDIVNFNPALAAANPNGIANPNPPDTKAMFVHMEFTF